MSHPPTSWLSRFWPELVAVVAAAILVGAICWWRTQPASEPLNIDEPAQTSNKEDQIETTELPGTYVLSTMQDIDGEDLQDDLDYFASLGLEYTLEIYPDGTAQFALGDDRSSALWDENSITLVLDDEPETDSSEPPASYTFDGHTLTITQNDGVMVFVRR